MHSKSLPNIRDGLTSAQECARLDNPDESTNMPTGKTANIKSLPRPLKRIWTVAPQEDE
jgi:hypothetical protein